VRAPLALDVEETSRPIGATDAMICIDVIHISRRSAVDALFEGARRTLPERAPLYLYGSYWRGGAQSAPRRCGVRGEPLRSQRRLRRARNWKRPQGSAQDRD
jgi:hypothetical protein